MKKKREPKPSEVIRDFLDYMAVCQKEYQAACSEMFAEDKKHQDFVHAINLKITLKNEAKQPLNLISVGTNVGLQRIDHWNWNVLQNFTLIKPINRLLTNCAVW